MATIVQICLRTAPGGPVRTVGEAFALAGRGLVGDHAAGGRRQLTLLDLGAWRRTCAELAADLDPSARRANVVVEGLDLGAAIGRTLSLGPCVVEVLGEVKPCVKMEQAAAGLEDALRPERRGGVYGRILAGGTLKVGDPASLL